MLRFLSISLSVLFCPLISGQVFKTGEPTMGRPYEMQTMTPTAYQQLVNSVRTQATFRGISKLPPSLSSDYRVGINLIYEGVNHSWILARDSEGFKLIPDLKGDGDLSRAQSYRFDRQSSKQLVNLPVRDDGGQRIVRFELVSSTSAGQWPKVLFSEGVIRIGTAVLDGKRIPFRLLGAAGHYNERGDMVQFDREQNNHFEDYEPQEGRVNVAGKTYEFQVDPKGASLTMRAVGYRPERPPLTNDSRMPEATLTDLEGKQRALHHPNADLTLLEFWDTHCGPCREEMPKLKALYARHPRSRFTIVGISDDESREDLAKYLADMHITWPECLEASDGPVHRLLRIEALPTYFLVRRDGTILDHWFGSGLTVNKVEAVLQ